jgi:ABC-type transport system involved in multi-copper enzyme maturation permease subunit
MNGALAAARAEWLRLTSSRRVLALPVAAALGAFYAWALGAAADNGVLGSRSGFYVVAAASSGIAVTCALVGALVAASAVAGDIANGVARTALCRPVSRSAWLAGRTGTLFVGMAALFVSAGAGALLSGAFRYGLHGAFEGDYAIATAGFLAKELAVAAALSLCAQAAAVSLGALMGALLGRVGAAVVAVALGGAALTALSRWPKAEPLLPVGFLTGALDRVAQLSQGIASAHAGEGGLRSVSTSVAWAVGALLLSAVAVQRRDILT